MTEANDSTSATSSFTRFFIASQLIGAILLAVVVGTVVLSRHIERSVTWTNLCITWIVSALSYSLLAFAGEQSGPQPSPNFCFTQSVLIYGAPVVTTVAGITLSVQLHMDFKAALSSVRATNPMRNTILCITPYIAYMLVILGAVIYGHALPVARTSTNTYCHFARGSYGNILDVLSVVGLLVNICLLGHFLVRLSRYTTQEKNIEAVRHLLRGIIRILLLQLILFIPIIVSVLYLGDRSDRYLFDAMIGIMPLFAFVILGVQPDLLQVWFPWRRRATEHQDSPMPEDVHTPILTSKRNTPDFDC